MAGAARLAIAGELTPGEVRRLSREWGTLELPHSVELDLDDAELVDGPACAAMVDAVRVLLGRGHALTLRRPPQALAHVLYRVGMMGLLRLVDVREDEPTVT